MASPEEPADATGFPGKGKSVVMPLVGTSGRLQNKTFSRAGTSDNQGKDHSCLPEPSLVAFPAFSLCLNDSNFLIAADVRYLAANFRPANLQISVFAACKCFLKTRILLYVCESILAEFMYLIQ